MTQSTQSGSGSGQVQTSHFVPRCMIGCFAKSPAARKLLEEIKEDPALARTTLEITEGGVETAIRSYSIGQTPELVIIEFDEDLAELDRLAEICASTTNVILLGKTNDVNFFREIMAKGITDYFNLPAKPHDLIAAISRAASSEEKRQPARMLTFIGSAGGVGSSTMAQSVAVASAQFDKKKTILFDLDVCLGSAWLNFDLKKDRRFIDLISPSKTTSRADIDQVLIDRNEKLQIIAAEASISNAVEMTAELALDVIEKLRSMTEVLVIDMPGGWTDLHEQILTISDEVIVTANRTLSSFQNCCNIFSCSQRVRIGLSEPLLVLNKSCAQSRQKIATSIFAKIALRHDPIEITNCEKALMEGAEAGKNPLETEAAVEYLDALSPLIEALMGETFGQKKHSSFASRIFSKWRN